MTPRDKRVAKQELSERLQELKRREQLYIGLILVEQSIVRYHENYLDMLRMKIADLQALV